MITFLKPLAAGNAVQILLAPPEGAAHWRVLRRTAGQIAGPDDAGAVLVADGSTDESILDMEGVANGAPHTYRAFYWIGAGWSASEAETVTPAATYAGLGPDVQAVVRERIELALAVEVARGALVPPDGGRIRVTTAPYALPDKVSFPMVSVHIDDDMPAERFIGELLAGDLSQEGGAVTQSEGWLSRYVLSVVGVSRNTDERVALRKAIKRAVMANLPIFDAVGMMQVQFSQRDDDQFGRDDGAALHFTRGTLTCLAPSAVSADIGPIDDVDVTANPYWSSDNG